MLKQPKAHFRRSRSLSALALVIPGTVLAWMSVLGHIGLFWQPVQMALMGSGGIIFWREAKRVKTASRQENLPPNSSDQPPTA